MKRMIVAISGFPRAGKDTFAGYLMEGFAFCGVPAKIVSFAEPVRSVVATMFPDLEPPEDKEAPLQYFGDLFNLHYSYRSMVNMVAKIFRDVHDDWWVRLMERSIENATEQAIIIPDLRFFVEHNMLDRMEQKGYYITRVVVKREEAKPKWYLRGDAPDLINQDWLHSLEVGRYDYAIANDQGPDELGFTASLLASLIASRSANQNFGADIVNSYDQITDLKQRRV